MKKTLASAKKVLVAIPDKFCVDTAAAALGLAYILQKDYEVQIGSVGPIPAEFSQVLDFSEFQVINKLKEKEIVLSLNRRGGKVKSVKWREVGKKIQFIVTPEESDFEFDNVDFETHGGEFDTIITVGVKSLDSLGNLYLKNPQAYQNTKIINIDINPENTNFGTVNEIGEELSLSNWILKLAQKEKLEINQKSAESLFKGVFWANEGFRKNGGLKKALEKFTSTGGELTSVVSQVYNTLTIGELRYMGKLIENMNIDSNRILTSLVSVTELANFKLDKVVFPEINIVSRVKGYKVALVLVEYEPGKILVRVYSKDENLDAFQLFSEYSPVGNMRRANFIVEGSLDQMESVLKGKVNKVYGNQKQNLQKVEKQEVKNPETETKNQTAQNGQNNKSQQNSPLKPATSYPQPQEINSQDQSSQQVQQPQYQGANTGQQQNPAAVYKPPLSPATRNFNANLPNNNI